MKKIRIFLANHTAEVMYQYEVLPLIAKGYQTEQAPDLFFQITEEDLAKEKEFCEDEFSAGALEATAFYRKFCEAVAREGIILFHGCVVETEGKAYIFTAPSGTGKSTHASLWLEAFGDKVKVLNGDKPLLREENGAMVVYGTPYRGKEGWGYPGKAPVAGICFLQRGEKNTICKISASEALPKAYKQLYLPKTTEGLTKAMDSLTKLLNTVPLWQMQCNISREAAELSYKTMTGELE